VGSVATVARNASAALEERHKIGCKRKGVDFTLFNIPASLNP
jgi:hypothetical protein